MYLDKRSNHLLVEVLKNPMITVGELQRRFELSNRQIDYSFGKINSWLEESNHQAIVRDEKGGFIVAPNLSQVLHNEKANPLNQYIFKGIERVNLIILMLGHQKEELSLHHLMFALGVSKNTVLRDLKSTQETLEGYGLSIHYSRRGGYTIVGDELDQRKALVACLEYCITIFHGEDVLKKFLNIESSAVEQWRAKLEQVEKCLNHRFIDQHMQILPYILEMILRRIGLDKTISESLLRDYEVFMEYETIMKTHEYQAAKILIKGLANVPHMEHLYITLQLLISSVTSEHYIEFKEEAKLREVLEMMVSRFEKDKCIQLVQKEELLKKLYVHIRPMYYRGRYSLHLKSDYTVVDYGDQQFKRIEEMVCMKLSPLEDFIGSKIPEGEKIFIKLLIASHFMRADSCLYTRMKAVVVCASGASVSRIMEQTLMELFPEFFFYQAMSVREFEETNLDYDLIFSSVPMEIKEPFFFINPIINEKEQLALRKRVMRPYSNFSKQQLDEKKADDILALIMPYVDTKSEKKLKKLLKHHFEKDMSEDCYCTVFGAECDYKLLCLRRGGQVGGRL